MSDGTGSGRQDPYDQEPQGGETWPIASGDAGPRDVLGPPVPTGDGRRNGGLRAVAIGGAAVVVLAAAGAVAYAASWLSGGGTQPEQVLPASAAAFAKVDLDPSAREKVDIYRLLRKFPTTRKQAGGDRPLKQVLVESLLQSDPHSHVRWSDIKPWLGDRAAIAAVPGVPVTSTDHAAAVGPVIAIQVTDQGKARAALTKIERSNPGDDLGWYFRDGYVVITATDASAARLRQAAGNSLAKQPTFRSDVGGLGGDQVAVGWVDVGRVAALVSKETAARGEAAPFGGLDTAASFHGRVALGAHADADAVEVTGKAYGGDASAIGAHGTAAAAGDVPADSLAVFSVAGLGPQLRKSWPDLVKQSPELGNAGSQLGLTLPDDLATALGDTTTAVVGRGVLRGDLDVAVRSHGDTATVEPAVRKVVAAIEREAGATTAVSVVGTRDGAVAAGTTAYAKAVAAGGTLGEQARFRNAVPGYRSASVVLYVDVAAVRNALAADSGHRDPDLAPLDSFGFTAERHGDVGTFRLRQTIR